MEVVTLKSSTRITVKALIRITLTSLLNGCSGYNPFIQVGTPKGGIQTEAAGIAYEVNYHGPGDNVPISNWRLD
jgi:hypothetical protein